MTADVTALKGTPLEKEHPQNMLQAEILSRATERLSDILSITSMSLLRQLFHLLRLFLICCPMAPLLLYTRWHVTLKKIYWKFMTLLMSMRLWQLLRSGSLSLRLLTAGFLHTTTVVLSVRTILVQPYRKTLSISCLTRLVWTEHVAVSFISCAWKLHPLTIT